MLYFYSIKQTVMKKGEKLYYTSRKGTIFTATVVNVTDCFADVDISVNGRVVSTERSKIYDVCEDVKVGTYINMFTGKEEPRMERRKVGEYLILHAYNYLGMPQNRNDMIFRY